MLNGSTEADQVLTQLAESSINIEAADEEESEGDEAEDREVPVAAAKETGSRGRRTNTSARRRPAEAEAM